MTRGNGFITLGTLSWKKDTQFQNTLLSKAAINKQQGKIILLVLYVCNIFFVIFNDNVECGSDKINLANNRLHSSLIS